MTGNWFGRPQGTPLALRKAPRLASWNEATDIDQVALHAYLTDTVALAASSIPTSGKWSMWLSVGLPAGRALTTTGDLDNYALPLASKLANNGLVSVWCSKSHSDRSQLVIGPAHQVLPPAAVICARTTASTDTQAYKQQVRSAVTHAAELAEGAVQLQIAFAVDPRRNWLNLWKPTIDALDPLLGRTNPRRDWHPQDGRIIDLGLHLTTDATLGFDVEVSIAATHTRG